MADIRSIAIDDGDHIIRQYHLGLQDQHHVAAEKAAAVSADVNNEVAAQ